jgi:hypothetical protein
MGLKRTERDINHTPLSSAEVKERSELYISTSSLSSWQVVWLTLPLLVLPCFPLLLQFLHLRRQSSKFFVFLILFFLLLFSSLQFFVAIYIPCDVTLISVRQ